MGEALGPEVYLQAIDTDIDPRHQQLDDAGLLGGEKLVPNWIQPLERLADVVLGQPFDLAIAPRATWRR